MANGIASEWKPLEQWSPALFLIGGGLLVGHAAMLGVRAFSNLTTPPDVFGPTGHLLALVGLFGLYPVLSDRTPTMARIAGAVTTVAVVSWVVVTVTRFLVIGGFVPSVSDVLPGVVFLLAFVSTILTYVVFGVTTLRVHDGSRVVGLLLLAPAGLLVVVLAVSAVTVVAAFEGFVIASGLALCMLALGYSLRTWDHPTDQEAPVGETTVG